MEITQGKVTLKLADNTMGRGNWASVASHGECYESSIDIVNALHATGDVKVDTIVRGHVMKNGLHRGGAHQIRSQ